MKVVILAGGLGTRLSEETDIVPKPMVEIGGNPILWHIMKIYAHFGFKEFVIALGYKGDQIKRFMLDYSLLNSNLRVSLKDGNIKVVDGPKEDWIVDLIDTGMSTETGGRVNRLADIVDSDTFMLTYGDGLSDVNLNNLLEFHRAHGKLATITSVRPRSRFGRLSFDGDKVVEFVEKPHVGDGWINGGFFVLEPKVLNYLDGDQTIFEREPLENLARDGQLVAYKHESFWQPMDTLREVRLLRNLWDTGQAPWKIWK
ncbi:MAG: glucose-1-phosphate cytidylyltransferase [Chloroflexota bacterium]|nr:glucose-1-phosphate cytidylyltransferase [Chloroflexota bacterium]